MHAVLACVVRSGVTDSVHCGSAVAIDPQGLQVAAAGDPAGLVLPRSVLKPLQAVAMLRAGLVLDGAPLALAASSHSGERFQLDGVARLLASGGLQPDLLQNTPDLPLDDAERLAWQVAGRPASRIAQNCSGKHAAMLLTCRLNDWPVESYRDPGHPLQRAVAGTIAELTGEPVTVTAVDGCGAPAFGLSLTGLARAFARLAVAAPGTPERAVAEAIRRHPEWLGGTDRAVTRLLRAVPGLIAKDGAEAVFAAALPDGCAVAVKIGDGGRRPLLPVVVALLHRLWAGGEALAELADVPVLGHGRRVGTVDVIGL